MRRHTLLAIVVIVAFVIPLLPQGNDKPSFEVASIKPNNSGDNRVMFRANGGRFTVAGATVKMLIQQAYRVRDFQLSGGRHGLAPSASILKPNRRTSPT